MRHDYKIEDFSTGDLLYGNERGNFYFALITGIGLEASTNIWYLEILDLSDNNFYRVEAESFSDWELQKS